MKITLVSSYFPTSAGSYRGHSALHIFRLLSSVADVTALVPLASYPKVIRRLVSWTDSFEPGFRPAGIETVYFRYPAIPFVTRPVNGFFCLRALLPLLRAASPDVIMNYWLYPDGYAAVRAGKILGVPTIVGSIGSDLRRITDPFTGYYVAKTVREAAAVVTVSEELRQQTISLGAAPNKITTIVNGCDTSIFRFSGRKEARRETGCDESWRLIVYVGSFLASKGLAELVDAFAAMARSMPAARLALVGEGGFRGTIERRAASAGILDRILFPGKLTSEQVASWMRAADVFCLPSYSEGCPNVIVEALACGCPIVASSVGGIPELCSQHSSILVPPRDSERLRQALQEALSKAWDRESIAAASRRGWKDAADQTLAVCRRVLEGRR
ncbi:MAG TPA: glycosyltransferase [Bryobacteraceae bacterium]|nr:glycosyltransferase [Bryobacteraceae bacterium]